MLVLSLSDFVNNAEKYMSREQTAPVEIENDGVRFVLMRKKKPSREYKQLLSAVKEAERLEKDTTTKRYTNMQEMWADIEK